MSAPTCKISYIDFLSNTNGTQNINVYVTCYNKQTTVYLVCDDGYNASADATSGMATFTKTDNNTQIKCTATLVYNNTEVDKRSFGYVNIGNSTLSGNRLVHAYFVTDGSNVGMYQYVGNLTGAVMGATYDRGIYAQITAYASEPPIVMALCLGKSCVPLVSATTSLSKDVCITSTNTYMRNAIDIITYGALYYLNNGGVLFAQLPQYITVPGTHTSQCENVKNMGITVKGMVLKRIYGSVSTDVDMSYHYVMGNGYAVYELGNSIDTTLVVFANYNEIKLSVNYLPFGVPL